MEGKEAKDRVGKLTMEIVPNPEPVDEEKLRQQRVEALTAWLLERWEQERREAA